MKSAVEYQRNLESPWLACFVFKNEYLELMETSAEGCLQSLCCKDPGTVDAQKQEAFINCRNTRERFKDEFIKMQFDAQEFVTENGKEVQNTTFAAVSLQPHIVVWCS